MKIWVTTLTAAVLIGGAVMALTPGTPSSPEPSDNETMVMVGRERGDGTMHFALAGKAVRGLYPGAVKEMRMTVVNPTRHRMRLQKLSGRVVSSSRRGCAASSLQVKAYGGKLPMAIEPYGRVTLPGTLPVTMPMGTSTKCAGARFTIALSGLGSREDGR